MAIFDLGLVEASMYQAWSDINIPAEITERFSLFKILDADGLCLRVVFDKGVMCDRLVYWLVGKNLALKLRAALGCIVLPSDLEGISSSDELHSFWVKRLQQNVNDFQAKCCEFEEGGKLPLPVGV